MLVAALVLTGTGEWGSTWAEQRKASMGQGEAAATGAVAGQPASRLSPPVKKDQGRSPKKQVGKKPAPNKPMGQAKERSIRRAPRRGTHLRPQATLTPKPDLSYHGLLEQPQRYRPNYNSGKGRAPNPNTGTVLHEHFQELDKNRDGSIDPFERASGRLDLDRDLADRRW